MSCVCSMFSGSISVTGGHRASSRKEETWEPLLSLSRRRHRGGNSPRGGSEGTASRGALPAAAATPPPPAGKCSSLKPPKPLRQVESEAPIGTFRSTGSEQAGRRLWPPGTGCHCDARRQPRRRLWQLGSGQQVGEPRRAAERAEIVLSTVSRYMDGDSSEGAEEVRGAQRTPALLGRRARLLK